jgi:hypothetical protein
MYRPSGRRRERQKSGPCAADRCRRPRRGRSMGLWRAGRALEMGTRHRPVDQAPEGCNRTPRPQFPTRGAFRTIVAPGLELYRHGLGRSCRVLFHGFRIRRAATSLLLNGTGFGSGIIPVPLHGLHAGGGSIFLPGTIGRISVTYPNPKQSGHFMLTSRISRDWLPGKGQAGRATPQRTVRRASRFVRGLDNL